MGHVTSVLSPEYETPILVVVASSCEDDHSWLRAIGSDSKWTIYEARCCREALSLASQHRIPVVICDRDLPGGGWKTVLYGLAKLPHRPRLIVSSRLADHHLWADVLSLGGYDVLVTPFDADEVFRVVSLARRPAQREEGHRAAGSATAA